MKYTLGIVIIWILIFLVMGISSSNTKIKCKVKIFNTIYDKNDFNIKKYIEEMYNYNYMLENIESVDHKIIIIMIKK